jgi:hypothetical protein
MAFSLVKILKNPKVYTFVKCLDTHLTTAISNRC